MRTKSVILAFLLGLTAASCGVPAPMGSVASAATAPATSRSALAGSDPASEQAVIAAFTDQTERAFQQVAPAVVKITHPVPGGGIALGSGTIIDTAGHILTNNHVAEGAQTYQVTLADNRTVDGKLVGLDPLDDLAVIQVNVPNLPVAQLGDSAQLQVTQPVLAIGNPIGFTSTVTSGIVSALDRSVTEPPDPLTGLGGSTIPNMIQTSAPINPGNSGGALVDMEGRLIGIPTLAATDPELGEVAQGIAFAVPVNTAKLIVPQLISQGKVTHSGRAYLVWQRRSSTRSSPISASSAVPLNFKNSGNLAEIDVQVGDTVAAGQVLAKLDPADLTASLTQAQANLASAQAAYDKLVAGAQPADVASAQAAISAAQTQLTSAKNALAAAQAVATKDLAAAQQTVDNAQQAYDDAVKAQQALPAVLHLDTD